MTLVAEVFRDDARHRRVACVRLNRKSAQDGVHAIRDLTRKKMKIVDVHVARGRGVVEREILPSVLHRVELVIVQDIQADEFRRESERVHRRCEPYRAR